MSFNALVLTVVDEDYGGKFADTFWKIGEGRIAAAMTLCERLPTKTISELKTVPMLDTSIDVWAEESAEDLLDALNTVHSSAAKLHHLSSGAQQKLCAALRSQSKTYRDLEVLANALRAFQEWRAAEDEALE